MVDDRLSVDTTAAPGPRSPRLRPDARPHGSSPDADSASVAGSSARSSSLLVLLFSLRGLAGFYTDFLWFDSLGQGSTWSSLLAAKVAPALVFTVVFFVIMFVNLVIADRLAPKYRSMGPEDELIARYQQVAGPLHRRIRIGVSLFFALIAGIGVSSQWQQWVLFTHSVELRHQGPAVPQGHRLLRLPAPVPQVHRRVALRRPGDRAASSPRSRTTSTAGSASRARSSASRRR